MKKHRGHYCRICGNVKSNESFSGKGHKTHVCKKCASLPKEKRKFLKAQDHVYSLFGQSHITDRNVSTLRQLAASESTQISQMATPMLEIVQAAPRKKQRVVLTMEMQNAISARWAELDFMQDDQFDEL